MSTQGNDPTTGAKKSVGELVADISEKFTALIRDELKLAQLQMKKKATIFGRCAAPLAVGGLIVLLYAIPVLLFAAINGLAQAVPLWLSALLIGLLLLLLSVVLCLLGLKLLKAAQSSPSPDLVGGMKKSIAAVKEGLRS